MKDEKKVEKLFNQLTTAKVCHFTQSGTRVNISNEQGVYVIYSPQKKVLHVGRTAGGNNGLNQRLNNHRTGKSSFKRMYLQKHKISLNPKYSFRFIEVSDPKIRTFLEAYAIGSMCPAHIGTGEKRVK